jgi:hypothetical protein
MDVANGVMVTANGVEVLGDGSAGHSSQRGSPSGPTTHLPLSRAHWEMNLGLGSKTPVSVSQTHSITRCAATGPKAWNILTWSQNRLSSVQ